MGQKTVTIQLPDEFYESAQEAAEASGRSLETVLVEGIGLLFSEQMPSENVNRLLAAMPTYNDRQLWTVVHQQVSQTQTLRLRELSAKRKQKPLSKTEQ